MTEGRDFARRQFWEAESYLVSVDEQLAGAVPWAHFPETVWQNIGCARLCLEEAYTALTERELTEDERRAVERGEELEDDSDLISEDDPRLAKLVELRDQCARLEQERPQPAASRPMIAAVTQELRELARAFGLPHEPG